MRRRLLTQAAVSLLVGLAIGSVSRVADWSYDLTLAVGGAAIAGVIVVSMLREKQGGAAA